MIRDFNDLNQAVFEDPNLAVHPSFFFWDQQAGATAIPPLSPTVPPPVAPVTIAALNNLGHVAGTASWGTFIWKPNAGFP